jgi:hypothetical protein
MSLVVGGARIYYHDPALDSYICFCTLHHRIQVVTQDRDAAEYYLRHGLTQFYGKYNQAVLGERFSGIERHQYVQWSRKIMAKFGTDIVIY